MSKKHYTDISAVWDDFVEYNIIDTSGYDIDSQSKLSAWIKIKDTKKRISDKLIKMLGETKMADKLLSRNKKVKDIVLLKGQGKTFGEIAKALKSTYWSVYNRYSRIVLKKKR